jgi:hypothetical protein
MGTLPARSAIWCACASAAASLVGQYQMIYGAVGTRRSTRMAANIGTWSRCHLSFFLCDDIRTREAVFLGATSSISLCKRPVPWVTLPTSHCSGYRVEIPTGTAAGKERENGTPSQEGKRLRSLCGCTTAEHLSTTASQRIVQQKSLPLNYSNLWISSARLWQSGHALSPSTASNRHTLPPSSDMTLCARVSGDRSTTSAVTVQVHHHHWYGLTTSFSRQSQARQPRLMQPRSWAGWPTWLMEPAAHLQAHACAV